MIYFILGYIIYLIIFAIFSLVIFYHLNRYGYREGACKTMMVIYATISISIIAFTFILLSFSGFSLPDNAQLFIKGD